MPSPADGDRAACVPRSMDDGAARASAEAPAHSRLSAEAAAVAAPLPRTPHLDISKYPTPDLLRMLAALLEHIATSNDQLRPLHRAHTEEHMNGSAWQAEQPMPSSMYLPLDDARRPTTTTAALSTLNAPSSTLCFHARHVPSISIEAYLLRILKYCPTTNDVFLSLLVYFDRMSRVGTLGNFPGEPPLGEPLDPSQYGEGARAALVSPSWSAGGVGVRAVDSGAGSADSASFSGIRGFAIDSFNVHRLVIAGITVASKFFSDVFYTNARYAKVGGLAVHELNQLELHFLLLNDFRLTIPLSEIQLYGDQLLAYAHDRAAASTVPGPPDTIAQEKNAEDPFARP
ncbi:cyclin-like protein interacting with PHO85 [Malassezia sp. CBS 17886]|nr:cyclin-like protein interacting with PHO85 [Malassezia sp. CBS 17886]